MVSCARRTLACAAAFLFLLAVGALSANAASLQVSPLSIEFDGGETSALVRIKNVSDSAEHLQVRVMSWRQQNGQDVLEPTRDIVASPPIARLAPGAEQVVRIIRASRDAAPSESTYRLLISQVPAARSVATSGVAILMQYSLPVFVASSRPAPANIRWQTEVVEDEISIKAFNLGGRRERVVGLRVENNGKEAVGELNGLAGYVLARSSMQWVFPANGAKPGDKVTISAQSDSGNIRAVAPIEARN